MSCLHVVREVLVELEPDQLRLPPGVMDLLRDGRGDSSLGHGDAVAKRHPQPAQPAQLPVLDGELGQRGRLDPSPLGPILLVPHRPRGLVVSLPREDGIVEARGRELVVGPRPAAVEQVAEAFGAVRGCGGRGSGGGGGGRGVVFVGGEAEVAEAVDDAVYGRGRGRDGSRSWGGTGGVGGRPPLQPRSAGAGGRAIAAGGGRGGGRSRGGGGRGRGEEAEREEAVDAGAGREAEGVVERELGERHGARADRRLGVLARWRHGFGVRRRVGFWPCWWRIRGEDRTPERIFLFSFSFSPLLRSVYVCVKLFTF
jgi:hypothetical protein